MVGEVVHSKVSISHLDVLGMVVETLADRCASQEDLGKLTTITTGLQSSVDTLGAAPSLSRRISEACS